MSYLTKAGLLWGQVPHTTGQVFFVSPGATYTIAGRTYSASDDHDGLSPERALRTVTQAITNATASVGDVIVLLEGTHTVTATIAVSKVGLTFVGLSRDDLSDPDLLTLRPLTILTSTGTTDELLNITASNQTFVNLTIRGTTATSAVSFQTSSALDNIVFRRCHFDLYTPAVSTSTIAVDLGNRQGSTGATRLLTSASAITNVILDRCTFESDGAQGQAVYVATGGVTASKCKFIVTTGTWASPYIVGLDSQNCRILDSTFLQQNNGAVSVWVDGSLANYPQSLYVARCHFIATAQTNAIRGFGANEVVADHVWAGQTTNRPENAANGIGIATFPAIAQLTS